MKKKFLTNLILLLVLNLLIKPFWILGIDLSVQNEVGTEAYGFYFSLFSFSLLLNIFLDTGITQYNTRTIARDPALLPFLFPGIVGFRFLLGILYFALGLGVGYLLGYSREQFSLLRVLLLNQFLASFILYFRSNLSGLHLFRTDSLLSVADRAIMIGICSLLLWGNITSQPFRIEWFVYAQTFSYTLTFIISFLLVIPHIGKFSFSDQTVRWKSIFRESWPFAFLVLLMGLYYRVDSVMLERMLPDGKYQAGLYAQAFRLLETLGMFAFLYAALLLPIFSRLIGKGDSVNEMVWFSFTLLMVPSVILVSALVFFSRPVMSFLYPESTSLSASLLVMLIPAFLGMGANYIFGTLLTANGSLKVLNRIAFLALTGNVILNLLLIPRYAALGSALASLFTQLMAAGLQFYKAKKILDLRTSSGMFMKWLVFVLLSLAAALLFSLPANNSWLFFGLTLILPALAAIFLGLIRPGDIRRILAEGSKTESRMPSV